MSSYAPFWETLKKKNERTYTLINKYGISSATIDRMRQEEGITTNKVNDLCKILQCKVQDILQNDEEQKNRNRRKRFLFFSVFHAFFRGRRRKRLQIAAGSRIIGTVETEERTMTIGQKIQTLRRRKGRTREELADALGVPLQTVAEWESDEALPDTRTVLALSRLFGVSTDLLLQPDLTLPGAGSPRAAEAPRSQVSASLRDPEPKNPYAAEADAAKTQNETPNPYAAGAAAASAGTREEQPNPYGIGAANAEEAKACAPAKKAKKKKKSVLIGAVIAGVLLLIAGCVILLSGTDTAAGGAVRKLLHLKPKAKDLAPAYVLVHGLGGWGEDAANDAYSHYWGNGGLNLPESLRALGYEVVAPSVGPVSSTWDRACELYAKLTGTRVDYGAAHAETHRHERYGRDYTEAGPMLPGWGETKTANLVGHSFGGETVRMLAYLLAYGDEAEQAAGQEDISPLFTGGKEYYVYSVTALCSPHNGSSLTEIVNNTGSIANGLLGGIIGQLIGTTDTTDLAARLIWAFAGLANPANESFDFMLDQFGITNDTGNFSDVLAAYSAAAGSGHDHAGYELTPDGAAELNRRVGTVPEIYYYSYAYCCTEPGSIGDVQVPSDETLAALYLSTYAMGSVSLTTDGGIGINKDWFPNDGLVNVISAKAPMGAEAREITEEEEADPGTAYDPGVWNVFPVRRGHHGSVLGMGRTQEETVAFYVSLFERTKTR